jgi:hypothetical protein
LVCVFVVRHKLVLKVASMGLTRMNMVFLFIKNLINEF